MLELFKRAALAGGSEIMRFYQAGTTTRLKNDTSPVTEADERAEQVILQILGDAVSDTPIIAEEAVAGGRTPTIDQRRFILVDPLDGTKEFINKNGDFTVNIALIEDGRPVCGIVLAPALGTGYAGGPEGAYKFGFDGRFGSGHSDPIRVRSNTKCETAVASRSHRSLETDNFLKQNHITKTLSVGSSLKFCLVAEGKADVYPRFGRTMEWDIAAGDAVLRAAGGRTVWLDGGPVTYGKLRQADDVDFANKQFIAWGGLNEFAVSQTITTTTLTCRESQI